MGTFPNGGRIDAGQKSARRPLPQIKEHKADLGCLGTSITIVVSVRQPVISSEGYTLSVLLASAVSQTGAGPSAYVPIQL